MDRGDGLLSGNLAEELVELEDELYDIQKTLDDGQCSNDEIVKFHNRQCEIIHEIQAINDTLKLHSVNVGGKPMYRRLF